MPRKRSPIGTDPLRIHRLSRSPEQSIQDCSCSQPSAIEWLSPVNPSKVHVSRFLRSVMQARGIFIHWIRFQSVFTGDRCTPTYEKRHGIVRCFRLTEGKTSPELRTGSEAIVLISRCRPKVVTVLYSASKPCIISDWKNTGASVGQRFSIVSLTRCR